MLFSIILLFYEKIIVEPTYRLRHQLSNAQNHPTTPRYARTSPHLLLLPLCHVSSHTNKPHQDENHLTSVSTSRLREPLVNLGTMTDDNPQHTSVGRSVGRPATGNNNSENNSTIYFTHNGCWLSPACDLDAKNTPFTTFYWQKKKVRRIESVSLRKKHVVEEFSRDHVASYKF